MPDQQEDPIYQEEQAHLDQTYAALVALRDSLTHEINVSQTAIAKDLQDMSEEIAPNFNSDDETMETLAAIEGLNSIIDTYNQIHDIKVEQLRDVLVLLRAPYFAKVRIRREGRRGERDYYIGARGMMDDDHNSLVIDWRAPIASTYYNQEMGATSYYVDGRRHDVELTLRRQFDITGSQLNSYFDTTVAIQDSLLLATLSRHHTEKLRDITATIQREQNEVVRHEDVPTLLVDGIAGSGKTSVLLQRIAYLFYQDRAALTPERVWLFTPNEVFGRYIDQVLPSLGETNPNIVTWKELLRRLGVADRSDGRDVDPQALVDLEAGLAGLELEEEDFREVRAHDVVLLRPSQVKSTYDKLAQYGVGPRLVALMGDDLRTKVSRRIGQLARNEELQEEALSLDLERQVEVFGQTIEPETDEERLQWARRYAEWLFADAFKQLDNLSWLRFDRIGMRLTGGRALSAAEYLWLRMAMTREADDGARYVVVDEVQDYTVTQLMVLARHFSDAHFLLLGDRHQAIHEGTATFDQIREVFGRTHGPVTERRLLTSYRSSPEITSLFCSLLPADERAVLSSVREAGVEPDRHECATTEDYLECLRTVCAQAAQRDGLAAVVAQSGSRVSWLAKQLGPEVPVVGKDDALPEDGIVLMDLALAKGLEFDEVVIPDAQAEVYPDTPLSRRRLYTAVSRAMHRVTLVSQGVMSPLLKG